MSFVPPHIVYSAVAMALWTLLIYGLVTVGGVAARASGKLSTDYIKTKTGEAPAGWVGNVARNLVNLFELPVLFYVLVVLHMTALHAIDPLQTWLAWGFVASRVIHSLIHITINNISLRFLAHRTGWVILIVMWVRFALAWPYGG